jgi:hypothetical protein
MKVIAAGTKAIQDELRDLARQSGIGDTYVVWLKRVPNAAP